jgi:hypothetical protein
LNQLLRITRVAVAIAALAIVSSASGVRPADPNGGSSAAETSGVRTARTVGSVRYPASYFSGPLGRYNPIPPRKGAFLLGWYGRTSIGWSDVKSGLLERQRAMGRTFDGIATAHVPSERRERWIHRQGALPIIAGWTPGGSPQQIASGERDRQIAAFAKYLKSYPFVVMVRMFHEFDMEHLSYHACGKTFVAMWRRVVSVMQQKGAGNVGFWWSPSEGYNRDCITNSYPGNRFVDWVGTDSYNHCFVGEDCYATPYTPGWSEFGPIFDYEKGFANLTTQHDRFGPSKPFVIGETGTVYDENHPSMKGDWYRNIVPAAKRMEYLRGIMFFDTDASKVEAARNNWHVDYPRSNPSVYEGYITMARDPWFNTRS